ncbi:17218_t:CDS:2 [Funneliformis caledonium]|uniref:17218_t:CDS:1 n=1 Tax=Funneliformis caledonium TaxID=1117310 RepID=A0A9N9EG55_9GLOM|nr:17218_t:CDS:2 [Funneliformis caledonium]
MLHKEPKQCELRNALADWLVTDSQPFNSANGEGFLHMINKLDPAFKSPCYVMIKKDIGYRYQVAFQAIKEMITHICDTVAITTDLWTSHAKSDYIRITCHWLTENMELYDILIYSKVNVAITNNSSNMIKAIHEWNGVNHIPCSAHILQLCVIKGLEKIKLHTKQFKELI